MSSARATSDTVARRRRRARVLGLLVVLGVVVSFVVENSQRVTVRLWFVTGHPRLIYVLAAAVVIGAAVGFLSGHSSRRRRTRRLRRRTGDEVERAGDR